MQSINIEYNITLPVRQCEVCNRLWINIPASFQNFWSLCATHVFPSVNSIINRTKEYDSSSDQTILSCFLWKSFLPFASAVSLDRPPSLCPSLLLVLDLGLSRIRNLLKLLVASWTLTVEISPSGVEASI